MISAERGVPPVCCNGFGYSGRRRIMLARIDAGQYRVEMAADTIINAVAKGRARVVVGWEAKAFDLLARISGPSYQRVVAAGVAKFFPWAK